MIALTNSFVVPNRKDETIQREPSAKRKRLYMLYLINDLLHHATYRTRDISICSKVQPALVNLFASVGSFKDCPKHHNKISSLLDLWEEKNFYSKDYIFKLREAVKNGSEIGTLATEGNDTSGAVDQASASRLAKSAPFIMPAMHGDPSTPWYDLPAGNLMPVIEPNSTRPINPDMIKPMQFVAGPASEDLVNAVKALLDDVKVIYGTQLKSEETDNWDIDELGQPVILDEMTGEILGGEGYYGWSRGFCEKMKRRKKGLDVLDVRNDRDKSRSRSSTPPRKRRYNSGSSSPEPRRPARRRRSYSSSRSPSPIARNGHLQQLSRNRSYSKSPRRSPSPKRLDSYPQRSPPRAPSMNQPPPPPPPIPFQQGFNPAFPPHPNFNNTPPPPPNYNNAPPPPPNFPGQWPPPPPPMHFNQQAPWPIPHPPPRNPQIQMNYQQGGYPQGNFPPPPLPPNQYPQNGQGNYPPEPPQGNFPPPPPGNFPANGPGAWQGYGNPQVDGRGWNNSQNNGGWNQRGGHRGSGYQGGGRGW
jgi:hypothetical protein